MSLNRRQFLVWGGAFGGLGLSVVAHRVMANRVTDSVAASTPAVTPPIATPPPAMRADHASGIMNPPRGDVRLVVISDLNSQYGSTSYDPEVDRAIALMSVWKPDLVLCGGDMVAGQKTSLTADQIRAMWAAFDRHVGAPLRQAQIPYGFTLGNHDGSGATSSNGQLIFNLDRELATAHWTDPRHNPGLQFVDRAHFPFYYTFRQNDLFFLAWDASTAQISAQQLAWVERSLASETAQSARLRIVIGHLPLYAVAVGRDRAGEYLNNAEALRSLLERYRVHTYISGHNHAYYPAHKGQLELLNSGLLGSGPRVLLNGNVPAQKNLTVVDVSLNSARTVYTTYNMQTLTVVNQQQLPRLLAAPNGLVLRRDVQWADLTPAERSLRYTPRG